jgi:4-amino-4-deoxy-L-arabinose transferase-like glycosyltransferase
MNATLSRLTERQRLLLLILAVIVIRFAYGLWRDQPFAMGGDAEHYMHTAEEYLGRREGLTLTRPPVYPFFLALIYVLPNYSLPVALAAQTLISGLTVWFAFQLAGLLGFRRAGWIAAFFAAADPFHLFFSSIFLSETLFTCLLAGGLVLLIRGRERDSFGTLLAAGLVFGTAALTRSVILPFFGLFCAALLIGPRPPARRALQAVCLAVGIALPLMAWATVLHHKTGHWVAVSVQKGWNSYEGLNENFEDPDAILRWQNAMGAEAMALGLHDPVKRDAYFWGKTKAFMREHPGRMAKLMVRKFLKFWRLYPYFPYSGTQRIISAIFMTPLILLALFGVYGVAAQRQGNVWAQLLLVLFILGYALLNTITWTQIRYRIPLHPLLGVWAAIGLSSLLQRQGAAQ